VACTSTLQHPVVIRPFEYVGAVTLARAPLGLLIAKLLLRIGSGLP